MLLIGLDRDGTLHPDYEYLGREENWKDGIMLYPDVVGAINALKGKGKVVVCTNQAGVARGFFTKEREEEVNSYIRDMLHNHGAYVDGWYSACYVPKSYAEKYNIPLDNPWVKEEEDRKPGIGMLKKACVDLGLKLEDCDVWYVGDKPADVLTGLNAGGRGIMVHNGGEHERVAETEKLVSEHPGKVFIVTSLGEAARIILDNV